MNMSAGLNEKLRGLLDSVARLASLPGLEHLAGEVLEEYGRLTGARGGSFYSREGPTLVLRGCLDPGHAPHSLGLPLRQAAPWRKRKEHASPSSSGALMQTWRGADGRGTATDPPLSFPFVTQAAKSLGLFLCTTGSPRHSNRRTSSLAGFLRP